MFSAAPEGGAARQPLFSQPGAHALVQRRRGACGAPAGAAQGTGVPRRALHASWASQAGQQVHCEVPSGSPRHPLAFTRRRQLPATQRSQPAGAPRARRAAGRRRQVSAAAGRRRRRRAAAAGTDGAGAGPVPGQPGRGAAPGGRGRRRRHCCGQGVAGLQVARPGLHCAGVSHAWLLWCSAPGPQWSCLPPPPPPKQVESTIVELGGIFQQLAHMVHEQVRRPGGGPVRLR